MNQLLVKTLLISDGRTTDMLEAIVDDQLFVHIIKQEFMDSEQVQPWKEHISDAAAAPHVQRESMLCMQGGKQLVVSHNAAVICPELIPEEMLSPILQAKHGIGRIMCELECQSSRKIYSYGWCTSAEATDFAGRPLKLQFAVQPHKLPFKEYSIHFGGFHRPGIWLREFFNPAVFDGASAEEVRTSRQQAN